MGTNRSRIRAALLGATLFALSAAPVRAASSMTFTVTTASDLGGVSCGATCSLRQAINAANANAPAADTIQFAVPGGPATITPTAALPDITDPLTIDGTTQVGTRLAGGSAGSTANGLHVLASGSVIRGITISGFGGDGLRLDGVHGTLVGGDAANDGNELASNGGDGIALVGDSSAVGNLFIGNGIHDNGELAIDLADDGQLGLVGNSVGGAPIGPNGLINGPGIDPLAAPVTSVLIHPFRAANGPGRADVYWSPTCPADLGDTGFRIPQAAVYLGSVDLSVDTGSIPHAYSPVAFALPAPRSSGFITATTTGSEGTSEVGLCEMIGVATDLAGTATVSPSGPIDVGSTMHIRVTATNLGPLTHTDPFGLVSVTSGAATFTTVTASQGSCFILDLLVACEVGELAAGASAVIDVDLIPTTDGQLVVDAGVIDVKALDPNAANDTVTLTVNVVAEDDASGTVGGGGGTVTSDAEGDGATPTDPIETSVTVPAGGSGTVTIAERPDAVPPPAGYSFFGQASVITAPTQTAAHPLVFQFVLDGTVIPTEPLVVFRNGVPVPSCTVANPATDPSATPDPCFLPTQIVGDDLVITVRTAAASTWRVGTQLPIHFSGFFAPVDNGGVLNQVKAGQAVPVKFSLEGNRGLNIFTPGSPTSKGIACGTARIDPVEQTVTAGSSSLSYDPTSDRYEYVWKSDKAWAGTCRQLTLTFADGSERTALFQFVK